MEICESILQKGKVEGIWKTEKEKTDKFTPCSSTVTLTGW